MKLEVIWTTSVLVVLLLSSQSRAYPMAYPHQAPNFYSLMADNNLGLWPRPPGVEESLSTSGDSSEGALWSGLRRPTTCRPRHADGTQRGVREQRSLYDSKRQDGKPNSLDLTFHLLREFMEMSRNEKLAQKAFSNKMLLQNIGK